MWREEICSTAGASSESPFCPVGAFDLMASHTTIFAKGLKIKKKKKTNQKGSRKIATDGGMRRRKEYKKNRTQKKWKKEEVKKESGKQNLIILCWFKVFPI